MSSDNRCEVGSPEVLLAERVLAESTPRKDIELPTRRELLLAGAAAAAGGITMSAASAQTATPSRPVTMLLETQPGLPPRPWERYLRNPPPPGEPNRHYKPVFVPNGSTLSYRINDGVKVFHLTASPIIHTVAEGLDVHCWGYNGQMPGPVIEVVQGDRVRIYVTNKLNAPTSIHWHAIILPNGMDGVPPVTQPAIKPGETFRYEFIFPDAGTFMYHPHFDNMTEEGMGLVGMIVVHPRAGDSSRAREPGNSSTRETERHIPEEEVRPPDRDFVIMLHEWLVDGGTMRPDPFEQSDFNILTMNGKVMPATYPLVCQLGDQVRIRWGNLSAMDHHPIHLHGYSFRIVATDGGPIPRAAQWPETTVLVPVGTTRDIEFYADNPGDWVMHCHMTHHTMNQMGHGFVPPLEIEDAKVSQKIRRLIPGYMTMGKTGMSGMTMMDMPIPKNTIPMLGLTGQYGKSVFGGMATVVKVREHAPTYEDPGWYPHPAESRARVASEQELHQDGIHPA